MAHVVAGAGRSSAALHEAAHALVRQELMGDLKRVRVNDKGAGKSEHRPVDLSTLSGQQLANLALIIFAGVHVEKELIPEHALSEWVIALDIEQAQKVQRWGQFSDEKMEELKEDAREIVLAREREIHAVARELNLRGRLSGEQVTEIAARARRKRRGLD